MVTDANNCTTTTTVTIAEPVLLEASIALANVVNVSCFDGNDGSAMVTVSGGTAPYTYLRNDTTAQTTATAIGLQAGTYTVTVTDANNCTTTTNVTITEPIAIDAPIALDQTFCMVERAEISNLVATGTDIQWYNVAVGGSALNKTNLLNTGTYYATQTINGCESAIRTAVQVSVYNTIAPIASNQEFCITLNPTVNHLVANGTAVKW